MAIAIALRRSGHEVAFYSGRAAQQSIGSEGFTLFPFEDLNEADFEATVYLPRTMSGYAPKRLIAVLKHWLVDSLPGQTADLQRILPMFRPDVIVSDVTLWAPGLVLYEAFGIPVAICSLALGCMVPGHQAPPWGLGLRPPTTLAGRIGSRLVGWVTDALVREFPRAANRHRSRYGLAPIPASVHHHLGRMPLYLVPSVPELDYRRSDLPASVHYVGPLVWSRAAAEGTPAWLDALPGDRPIVHVAEGTVHSGAPFLLRAAAQGLAGLPMSVVMTCGPRRNPDDLGLGPLAENVRLERWVPHTDLLPRTRVVVTTGGAGTTLAALAYGIPVVMVPTDWDKPDNARRVVEAGVGIIIAPGRCTTARLRGAVQVLLTDRTCRERARRISASLLAAGGAASAATLLERLVPTNRRVAASP